ALAPRRPSPRDSICGQRPICIVQKQSRQIARVVKCEELRRAARNLSECRNIAAKHRQTALKSLDDGKTEALDAGCGDERSGVTVSVIELSIGGVAQEKEAPAPFCVRVDAS